MSERTERFLRAHYGRGYAPAEIDRAALAKFQAGAAGATAEQRTMVAERIYTAAERDGKGTGANIETSLAAADWLLSL